MGFTERQNTSVLIATNIYANAAKHTNGTGGMLLDEDGRLLACFLKSHKLVLKSEDGSKCDNVFGPDIDALDKPYSISFRKSDAA